MFHKRIKLKNVKNDQETIRGGSEGGEKGIFEARGGGLGGGFPPPKKAQGGGYPPPEKIRGG